eukprot:CAMPEP_0198243276 /NCGR_PEP_ID=MMETSP1446-20131203/26275_1 /TAXON_ID=1461542 ORGANISM="Unidentified sp, Strain CCMP2111" /NCGR_SAMPLE_ID=MMETSP1446 /ASSEMBLY_ACC=CAM_ASM_001112 /LENGTH=1052 /DNA_ID=CAMNT_0043927057 /DNA_START=26 /DNA_END=3184 /DNA_ORIENTATION=+
MNGTAPGAAAPPPQQQVPQDIANLCQILQGCLSPQREVMKVAEEQLKLLEKNQGQSVNLLQVTLADSLDLAIRQVAAISFKNLVSKGWGKEDDPGYIPAVDRDLIKQNLLQALIHAPPLVRVQLGECLKSIVYVDYPKQWPALLSEIHTCLVNQDTSRLYGGLFALRMLTRKYEYKNEDERVPLYEIVNSVFPILVQIFQQLISLETKVVEHVEMMKLICKIFWSTVYLSVPQLLMQPEHSHAWMNCFKILLQHPVPQGGSHNEPQEPWWKLKKWVLHIVNRLFNKYGISTKLKKEPYYPFALFFETNCTCQFLETILRLLACLTQGQYVSPRSINLALQYLTHALPHKLTYGVMKPHFQQIMFSVLFPLACFQNEDSELWEEDPHEYVRKGYDLMEDLYSPRSQVMHFFIDMASYKHPCKENLPNLVNHLGELLRQFISKTSEGRNTTLERQADGALLIMGSLSEKLKSTVPYKNSIEQMLHHFMLPILNHPAGHLRAKAVWCLGMFADFKFQEGRGKGSTFSILLSSTVARLQDPELPVRVDASVALRSFVEILKDLELLRPLLPQLLNEFLKLINEVDNDDMINTLEAIVEKFEDEIAPFALTICQHLAQNFWKCIDNDEDDDGMGALAALGCLRAMTTILESVSSIPDLYNDLEPVIFPIMHRMISTEGQDVLEEVLEIVSYFTYYAPSISPNMWRLWPMMVEAVSDWAIEYFENILVPLDNFISRGTEYFLTWKDPDFLQSAYQLVERTFNMDLTDDDLLSGPRLLECIMLHCKGRVDHYIEPFILLAVAKLKTAQKNLLKDLLMQVVANALYYNAALTVQILQKHGLVSEVFTVWFQMIWKTTEKGRVGHFRRENDKKINVLGLCSLLHLQGGQVPPEINAGGVQVIQGLAKLCADLKELRDKKEGESESEEEGSSDEDEEDEEEVFDEDDEEDEDEDTSARFKSSRNRDLKFEEEDDDEYDDEWDDILDYWDEDEDTASPLDQVDAHVFFTDSLTFLQGSDPARFASYTGTLDTNTQQALQAMAGYAAQRRQTLAKLAAENAATK